MCLPRSYGQFSPTPCTTTTSPTSLFLSFFRDKLRWSDPGGRGRSPILRRDVPARSTVCYPPRRRAGGAHGGLPGRLVLVTFFFFVSFSYVDIMSAFASLSLKTIKSGLATNPKRLSICFLSEISYYTKYISYHLVDTALFFFPRRRQRIHSFASKKKQISDEPI